MAIASKLLTLAILALSLFLGSAQADMITFDLSSEYTGGTEPEGSAPWLRAVFDDGGTAGSVTLTLEAINLTGSEFVSNWYFNFEDDNADLSDLAFGSSVTTGTFDPPGVSVGEDGENAGGGVKFDIKFSFTTSNSMGGAKRFTNGDKVTISISDGGEDSITVNSFNLGSPVHPDNGSLFTSAHVQSIGTGGGSGWVTVPEPTSAIVLAGVGLFLCCGRRRTVRG